MILSRRRFLAGTSVVALPLIGVPVPALGAAPQPYAVGELWGMPFVARGAVGVTLPRARRQTVTVSTWSAEFS